jgi:hypothetical protein
MYITLIIIFPFKLFRLIVDRFVVAAVFVVDDVVAVVDVVMVMVVGAATAGLGTDMDDVVIDDVTRNSDNLRLPA